MGQQERDEAMRERPGRTRRASPPYVLAAAIIWGLVLYSLSPWSRTEPARLASRAVRLCEQALR